MSPLLLLALMGGAAAVMGSAKKGSAGHFVGKIRPISRGLYSLDAVRGVARWAGETSHFWTYAGTYAQEPTAERIAFYDQIIARRSFAAGAKFSRETDEIHWLMTEVIGAIFEAGYLGAWARGTSPEAVERKTKLAALSYWWLGYWLDDNAGRVSEFTRNTVGKSSRAEYRISQKGIRGFDLIARGDGGWNLWRRGTILTMPDARAKANAASSRAIVDAWLMTGGHGFADDAGMRHEALGNLLGSIHERMKTAKTAEQRMGLALEMLAINHASYDWAIQWDPEIPAWFSDLVMAVGVAATIAVASVITAGLAAGPIAAAGASVASAAGSAGLGPLGVAAVESFTVLALEAGITKGFDIATGAMLDATGVSDDIPELGTALGNMIKAA